MEVSYDKLFSYMKEYNISKSRLADRAGISRNSVIKMANGQLVHLSVIIAICEAYGFKIEDVVQIKS